MSAQRYAAFVREYLVDLNGKQAAIRAGYNPNYAHTQASRLLANPKVKAMVDEAMAERVKRTEITADWVLENLKSVANRCMQQEAVRGPDGEPTGEFKFDASGANRALELIGKHLGMFTDKVEHSGGVQVISANPMSADEWEDQYTSVGAAGGAAEGVR